MRTPEEIIGLRRVVIERFHRLNRVPTVTINMDARVEAALAFKDSASRDPRANAYKATLNHVVLKATAMALREHLLFNHDYNGRGIIWENDRIDIRTPVDMGEFPMHIVVPDTDRKDIFEIAASFNEKLQEVRGRVGTLMEKYIAFQRDRPLLSAGLNALTAFSRRVRPLVPPWDRRWYAWQHRVMGTFMVTNMGTLGVIDCHGQLVRPSIGALLVLAVREVVEVEDGAPVVRRYLPLALEFDNRVAETAQAGAFLAAIKRNIEEPERYCA
jgi:pyruvate/2-oxoglutarate dehydrogenase complex dihydrolipoamide acyltransferase (E2) component